MRSKAILSCLTAAAVTISPLGLHLMTGSVRADSDDIELSQISDTGFRAVLSGPSCDADQNGVLSKSEREAVTILECESCDIASLSGIELFPNLEILFADRNHIQSLDLSNNLKLEALFCEHNQLTTLNVSACTKLKNLNCADNKLKSLDVSKNTGLLFLNCSTNELKTLNVNANTSLETLTCNSNQLTSLSVANNTALYQLAARENPITALNIAPATYIANAFKVSELQDKGWYYLFEKTNEYDLDIYLDFGINVALTGYTLPERIPFMEINENTFPDPVFQDFVTRFDYDQDGFFSRGELDSVDMINCTNMGIVSLEGIDYFENLTTLECYDNQIEVLDLSGNMSLRWLYCWDNPLQDINLGNNPELVYLDLTNCLLEHVDLSQNLNLKWLAVSGCPLTELDVSNNLLLEHLLASDTHISTLDLQNCALFQYFDVNELTNSGKSYFFEYHDDDGAYYYLQFDVTTSLVGVELPNAIPIVEISEEHFPDAVFRDYVATRFDLDGDGFFSQAELDAVGVITCDYMDISSLAGIEYFTKLYSLSCNDNDLDSLDLSANTDLESLWLCNLPLTELDLTNNTDLCSLFIELVPIASLDLTKNTKLYSIDLRSTEIPSIDIRNCSTIMSSFTVDKLQDKGRYYEYKHTDSLDNTSFLRFEKNTSLTGFEIPAPVQVVEINETNFPDEHFRECVKSFDYDSNGWLSQPELDCTDQIYCPYQEIVSLTGISYFANLESLSCYGNSITELDLSGNVKLQSLYIYDNPIQTLNVSANVELQELDVQRCPLTELELADNKKLVYLDVRETQIQELDIRDCSALMSVFDEEELVDNGPHYSFMKETDDDTRYLLLFSKSTNLVGFEMPAQLDVVAIDESSFPDSAFREYVTEFDYDGNGYLSQVELDSVKQIYCAYAGIFDMTGIEYFTNVIWMDCINNFIEDLDLSALTNLEYLNISNNPITSIDLAANKELTGLIASNCPLTELNLDNNAKIQTLLLQGTEIASLDISGCTDLVSVLNEEDFEDRAKYFYFGKLDEETGITYEIYISKNTTLLGYALPQPVDVLAISEETFPDPVFREYVKQFDYDDSGAFSQVELDDVGYIDCSYTEIESLKGIEYFTNLEFLDAISCELKELHLDKNTKLISVYCSSNHLKSLDLSNNTLLQYLNVSGNLLSKLDISTCPKLVYLCANAEAYEYDSVYSFNLTDADGEYYFLSFDTRTELVGYGLPTEFALDIDEINFPDPNFRSYASMFDTNGNAWFSRQELDAVQYIDTTDEGITSMKGIEHFPNLISLSTAKNPLTELDLSNNTKLKSVYISEAKISELDLSKNTEMVELYCCMTPVSDLELGENSALKTLTISLDSKLTELDLRGCPSLESLTCCNNKLTSLNLSNNMRLTYLDCSDNKLTSLNVENCYELQDLACYRNNLSSLRITSDIVSLQCNDNALTSLDLSRYHSLKILTVQGNEIPSLEIYMCKHLVRAYEEATAVDYGTYYEFEIDPEDGPYCWLTIGKDTEVIAVDPVLKPLVQINEENFPDSVFREFISQYDETGDGWFSQKELNAVSSIRCSKRNISSLKGVEYFKHLEILECGGNKLQNLDVSQNTILNTLYCEDNSISHLNLGENTKLDTLRAYNNKLTELNVSRLPSLILLNCDQNQIGELFLSNNLNLEAVYCSENKLDNLNVKNLTKLRDLDCSMNNLSALDVSMNTELQGLRLHGNKITSVNVQNCPVLVSLITNVEPNNCDSYIQIVGNVSEGGLEDINAMLTFDPTVQLVPKSPFISTPTPTKKVTPTPTKKATPTPTKKVTPTPTKKATPTPTKKVTPTPTKKVTPTPTKKVTPTPTKKVTPTPTKKVTPTPTKKATPTPTKKTTPTPTKKATPTPTKKATPTPTKKVTPTPTKKATPTPTKKATPTPTKKVTPTPTKKVTPTPTKKATPTPTKKVTPTPTKKVTPTPTKKVTPTPTKKATPTPTKKATPTPTKKTTPTPTKKVTPTPTKKVTPTPTKKATPTPTKKVTPTPTKKATPTPTKAPSFEEFVERLYVVALNRASDPSGKEYWVNQVQSKAKTGGDCARFFLLDAPEFMNRNLSVEDFVETLYKTFFDRASDPAGKQGWVNAIRSGSKTRAEVVNDFIESDEWVDVCAMYGVESGAKYHFGTHPSYVSVPLRKNDNT